MARPQADHRAAARLSRARRGGRRGTRTARRPHASDSARAARSAAQIRAVTSGPIQPHLHKRRRWRAAGGGGDGEGGPKGEAFCWEARERPPRRGATRREKVAMDKPSMPASQRVVADAQPPNREEEGGRAERKEVQGEQRGRRRHRQQREEQRASPVECEAACSPRMEGLIGAAAWLHSSIESK